MNAEELADLIAMKHEEYAEALEAYDAASREYSRISRACEDAMERYQHIHGEIEHLEAQYKTPCLF
jgi:ferritin